MVIEVWLLPSILALLVWGVTGFLSKIALRGLPPLHLLVYSSVFFLLSAVLVQLFYGGLEFNQTGVLLAICIGAAGSFGQLLFLVALRDGPLTYVSMISSLYPLVATVLAVLVLSEPISPRQAAGIALGIASIILLVVARDKQPA
jgi:drug/metabolite transporter (DMT)-like permease